MGGERYVALGLAHVRSSWFTEVARWSTAGSLPLEFVKCVSGEEVRARLATGRRFSAVVVDAGLSALDRDLVDAASAAGAATLVVADGRTDRDTAALGVAAVLQPGFSRADLLAALQHHTSVLGDASDVPRPDTGAVVAPGWRGRLVAVTGAGGVGSSTVAMALAQGLGDDPRYTDMVSLVDCSLDADLALLHDARDVVPGVQELVEAHRTGRPPATEVRDLSFAITNRRYHLVLGLRRHRDWTSVRPRAFEAAVDGLLSAFRVVVADIDADLEGEAECGSYDVEERNVMSRTIAERADIVVAVGHPGVKGVSGLVRTIGELRDHGVAGGRIVAVVNRSGRNVRARAELTRALAQLTAVADGEAVVGPVFLPDRRGIDDVHRDGARLPAPLCGPLAGAVRGLFERTSARARVREPVSVAPGALGSWSDEGATT